MFYTFIYKDGFNRIDVKNVTKQEDKRNKGC